MNIQKSQEKGLQKHSRRVESQSDMALLLGERIRSYTSGNSSVKDETAIGILNSIYYCIKAYSMTKGGRAEQPGNRHLPDIRQTFEAGKDRVKACFIETQALYCGVAARKLCVPLAAYNETLDQALPEFFNTYDLEFFAHEIRCSMDYPLAFDVTGLEGVFYIRQYLERLRLEDTFCRCFPRDQILWTLSGFQKKHQLEALDAPANLFGILFDQQALSLLCGNGCPNLTLWPLQIEGLNEALFGKTPSEIRCMLAEADDQMIRAFEFQDPLLIQYIRKYEDQLAWRLLEAAAHGNISDMAFLEGDDPGQRKIAFQDGERMSDTAFVHLVEGLGQCGSTAEKVERISETIRAMSDYADLLAADCLFDDDYQSVFKAMGVRELAVLGKEIFKESLKEGPLQWLPSQREAYKKGVEALWQSYYIDYLFSVDDASRQEIVEFMERLQE